MVLRPKDGVGAMRSMRRSACLMTGVLVAMVMAAAQLLLLQPAADAGFVLSPARVALEIGRGERVRVRAEKEGGGMKVKVTSRSTKQKKPKTAAEKSEYRRNRQIKQMMAEGLQTKEEKQKMMEMINKRDEDLMKKGLIWETTGGKAIFAATAIGIGLLIAWEIYLNTLYERKAPMLNILDLTPKENQASI
eukprot:TRINITY_DN10951_c0_g1_i1.p3 TRINITY_DN10951_c0_g1~~TRINITY_DN10951_c0_g1_i1.p3  ORF type:complete len:191 (-),score=65.73 TRINITY_DN10951_c0_g1_i1:107-679(-)